MKKIMFNDKYGLTQAVLEGRKTQTRRIAHLPEGLTVKRPDLVQLPTGELRRPFVFSQYGRNEEIAVAMCYGNCGTWFFPYEEYGDEPGYTNKMFVKAELMPYTIKITNTRIEHLQDISEEDCIKEGVMRFGNREFGVDGIRIPHSRLIDGKYAMNIFPTARQAFANLIDKVSGKGTWESNPWVFVYDFKLVK